MPPVNNSFLVTQLLHSLQAARHRGACWIVNLLAVAAQVALSNGCRLLTGLAGRAPK
jgi:hypothetical protein